MQTQYYLPEFLVRGYAIQFSLSMVEAAAAINLAVAGHPQLRESMKRFTQSNTNADASFLAPRLAVNREKKTVWNNGYKVTTDQAIYISKVFPKVHLEANCHTDMLGGWFSLVASLMFRDFYLTHGADYPRVNVLTNEFINSHLNSDYNIHYIRHNLEQNVVNSIVDQALVGHIHDLTQCPDITSCKCALRAPLLIDQLSTKITVESLGAILAESQSSKIETISFFDTRMLTNMDSFLVDDCTMIRMDGTGFSKKIMMLTRSSPTIESEWFPAMRFPIYTLDEILRNHLASHITVTDVDGKQKLRFFKENQTNHGSFLISTVTPLANSDFLDLAPLMNSEVSGQKYIMCVPPRKEYDMIRKIYPYDLEIPRRQIDEMRTFLRANRRITFSKVMDKWNQVTSRAITSQTVEVHDIYTPDQSLAVCMMLLIEHFRFKLHAVGLVNSDKATLLGKAFSELVRIRISKYCDDLSHWVSKIVQQATQVVNVREFEDFFLSEIPYPSTYLDCREVTVVADFTSDYSFNTSTRHQITRIEDEDEGLYPPGTFSSETTLNDEATEVSSEGWGPPNYDCDHVDKDPTSLGALRDSLRAGVPKGFRSVYNGSPNRETSTTTKGASGQYAHTKIGIHRPPTTSVDHGGGGFGVKPSSGRPRGIVKNFDGGTRSTSRSSPRNPNNSATPRSRPDMGVRGPSGRTRGII